MSVEKLREIAEEILDQLNTLDNELDSAKQQALSARDYASNAESEANNAYCAADSADDYLCNAQGTYSELSGQHDALCTAIDALDPASASDGTGSSLTTDIAKHKREVYRHFDAGWATPRIAEKLKISEVLVDMIRRQYDAEKQVA